MINFGNVPCNSRILSYPQARLAAGTSAAELRSSAAALMAEAQEELEVAAAARSLAEAQEL